MVEVQRDPRTCAIVTHIVQQHHFFDPFPRSQGELIKRARGALTQTQFARQIGVERSCLSRYESEKLGAPTKVLNHCLSAIAAQMDGRVRSAPVIAEALLHARRAVALLENPHDES